MTRPSTSLTLVPGEATVLHDLVTQFAALVRDGSPVEDAAVGRLVPDAYRDDDAAAREFRDLTQRELLDRRAADAGAVLADLAPVGGGEVVDLALDDDRVEAWLRTLAAVRLVLADRLGIVVEEDHRAGDPRFELYDWLGYRLESLIQASDG